MFRDLSSLLRNYRQNDSEDECQISSTESDDDEEEEVGDRTTTADIRSAPPLLTWKLLCSITEAQEALADSAFSQLPAEILIYVFRLLGIADLTNVALVCRYFKVIADQDDIWRPKCNPSRETPTKSFKQMYIDWIYGKYIRKLDLKDVKDQYRRTRKHTPCLLNGCACSSPTENGANRLIAPGFVAHPNSSPDMIINLSIDVDRTVIALIAFLEKASTFLTSWYRPTVIQQMITRYYRFLQLKALYPHERLIATLDVEIIWHTHLIRPEIYRGDCLRLFHRVIDHSLLVEASADSHKEEALRKTCLLYEKHFGELYCCLPAAAGDEEKDDDWSTARRSVLNYIECAIPAYSYWDETRFQFAGELPNACANPFSFVEADVILDSNWFELYCNDMYEVGLRIMIYNSYTQQNALHLALKQLSKSYERFLYLAGKFSSTDGGHDCIHPTYAIDIIWHSHMQEPLKYAADCEHLLGFTIDHAPWSATRTAEQITDLSRRMSELWKAEFDRSLETDHLE